MEAPFAMPRLGGSAGPDGWIEEITRYRVSPRPKSKFKTTIDSRALFGDRSSLTVTTRARADRDPGEPALELRAAMQTPHGLIEDTFVCVWQDGLRPATLTRTGTGRELHVDFVRSPYTLPDATYPEVLLPFLLRGQPRDKARRALYSWTSDLFVARVYYETRGASTLRVPAGAIEAHETWMYPDLNDWIALGGLLTRLAKPLLPRYTMWHEVEAPHRVVRFEGPFGPPGAPEIVLELATNDDRSHASEGGPR